VKEDVTDVDKISTGNILKQAFTRFFDYSVEAVGYKKTKEFASHSHNVIQGYFRNLQIFQLGEEGQIAVLNEKLTDKDILAFSVWMQQFLKELKDFMIGLGKPDAARITGELQGSLKSLGFYVYFEQARDLDYST